MTTTRVLLLVALAAVARLACADDAAPVMPPADAVDAAPPAPPIAVRHDAVAPRTSAPRVTAAAPPRVSLSVDVPIATKPRVNRSPHFVFTDTTDRTAPPIKSLAERQAAVEAVRRSLRRTGGRR